MQADEDTRRFSEPSQCKAGEATLVANWWSEKKLGCQRSRKPIFGITWVYMPFANANGINLYYEIHGKGEPLILIGGFSGNHYSWEPKLPFLSPHYQILLLDNRGSGQSDYPPGPYSVEMMAEDVIALMEHVGFTSTYFVGHSLGGAIVQQIAIAAPHRIKGAVLASTFAKFPAHGMAVIDLRQEINRAGVDDILYFQSIFPWLYSDELFSHPAKREELFQKALSDPHPQRIEGYLAQAEALRSVDLRKDLGKIQAPCLIIHGENDPFSPLRCAQELKDKIPNSTLQILKGQSHCFDRERPREFSEAIHAFLKMK